jgi:hypothetical protein
MIYEVAIFIEVVGWIGFLGGGLFHAFRIMNAVFPGTVFMPHTSKADGRAATDDEFALYVISSAWFVAGAIILSIKYLS